MLNTLALDTAWTRGLRRGERPAASALIDHLREVHRRHPGFTESCARRCRDQEGRTSYDWLAGLVEPRRHAHVLDLCCGSGPLLALLAERLPETALTGVDASSAELALAAARLPKGRARLVEGLAQDLSFIESHSVDAVLCHWALTLVEPVGPVLAEVRRILRPGGLFAAVTDGPADIAPGYGEIDALISGWVRRALPGYGEVDLGDPRVRTGEDLADLARAAFPGAAVSIDSRCVRSEGPADDLAEEVAGFFYAAFVLSTEDRRAMLQDLSRHLEAREARGAGGFTMPVNVLCVTMP